MEATEVNARMQELSKIREGFMKFLESYGYVDVDRDYALVSNNKDGSEFTVTMKIRRA